MSNVVNIIRDSKETTTVQPSVALQKFSQFQHGGSCSTSVPSFTVEELLAWWGQMFSEVDDGCGNVPVGEGEDAFYDDADYEDDDDGDHGGVFG